MSSIRRLSDSDVETIFNCIRQNMLPPSSLRFRIVPVGSDGLKLSPPSYEFEDGLYILLKPQKKSKVNTNRCLTKVPSNLEHLVMDELPKKGCTWSLSGPQFPRPTRVQQRYCYPKGNVEYSSQRGGALWTMFFHNRQEDLEYRLLHVYFSPKRAVNQSKKNSNEPIYEVKKRRQKPSTVQLESPLSMSSLSGSPVPFYSPFILPSLSKETEEIITEANICEVDQTSCSFSSGQFPQLLQNDHAVVTFSDSFTDEFAENNLRLSYENNANNSKRQLNQDLHDDRHLYSPNKILHLDSNDSMIRQEPSDSNHTDIHPTLIDFKTCWLEPIPLGDRNKIYKDSMSSKQRIHNFSRQLHMIHSQVKENIKESPETEQAFFLSLLSSWAKRIAQDPLNLTFKTEGDQKIGDDTAAV